MYYLKQIDPFTGAPVSKLTSLSADYMILAFSAIEGLKKKEINEK